MSYPLYPEECAPGECGRLRPELTRAQPTRMPPNSLGSSTSSAPAPVDYEVVESFVCNADTNLYDRVTAFYADGVLQSQTVAATTTACEDAAPVSNDDYEYTSVELCVSGQVQVQFYRSVNGAAPVAFGAPILTGRECGQGEYVGQICYEEIPGYVVTVATTGFVANSDDQANSSTYTISYNGSGLDLNAGRIFASIRSIFGAASNFVARLTDNNGVVYDSNPVGGITGVFQSLEFVWPDPPSYGPGETLELTFVGSGGVRVQTQTGFGGTISGTGPLRRPIIQLDRLLEADPKRTAYGIRSNGVVTYYDVDTSAILAPGTYVVCPPLQESLEAAGVRNITDTAFQLVENTAGQTFPVGSVAYWSVTARGPDPITVDFGDGNVVSVLSGDTLEYGDNGENRGVSSITFSTGASSLGLVTYGTA